MLTKEENTAIMPNVLVERYKHRHGILAQLGEHLPYKQRVIGSSPIGPIHGEIAQLARAHGSYPWCRGFKSLSRYYNKEREIERFLFLLFYNRKKLGDKNDK